MERVTEKKSRTRFTPEAAAIYRARWRAKNPGYRSATAKPRSFYRQRWVASASPEQIAEKKAAACVNAQKWYKAHPDQARTTRAAWFAVNRDKSNAKRIAWYVANKAHSNAASAAWVAANKDRYIAYKRAYYEVNCEALRQKTRDWNKANPGRNKLRRAIDIEFVIMCRLRTRLRKAVLAQGAARAKTTTALVGCSPAELRAYIEAQFLPGMGWHNRSEWHLDHKLPCSHFDLTDPAQQVACFHFSNLRPLWEIDNRRKSAKVLPEFLRSG